MIYPFFVYKYPNAHCKHDIIVQHKSELVTSFIHKWLHVNALWVTNRNVGYVLSMLEHDINSQWLRISKSCSIKPILRQ